VPQGQAELVLREERKARVLPLQEQQAWRPEVLSGRPVPLREPEALALTVLHWVRRAQRISPLQEARWLAGVPQAEPLASSDRPWLLRPWLPFPL
jgi:hypothetical protein